MRITPEQCRIGRAMLDWTQKKMADEIGFHINQIWRFEKCLCGDIMNTYLSVKIEDKFKEAGISFSEDDENFIIKRRKDV